MLVIYKVDAPRKRIRVVRMGEKQVSKEKQERVKFQRKFQSQLDPTRSLYQAEQHLSLEQGNIRLRPLSVAGD